MRSKLVGLVAVAGLAVSLSACSGTPTALAGGAGATSEPDSVTQARYAFYGQTQALIDAHSVRVVLGYGNAVCADLVKISKPVAGDVKAEAFALATETHDTFTVDESIQLTAAATKYLCPQFAALSA